jgi:predicted dehydrogenase
MGESAPLRMGTLGAARITPSALVRPAAGTPDLEVVAVAARDRARAERFAAKQGIPRVHPSYEALLEDPDVDAVYNPLPNSLHCEWTLRALHAGKHVLCEKPLASNAQEARRMQEAAEKSGRVLAEAFHWRYHPLAERMQAILDGGELGPLRHVQGFMCAPLPLPGNIRYRLDLAGGATMDTGCYAVSLVRFLAGAEPEVVSARARCSSPGVDRWMQAELRFPDGVSGRVTTSIFAARLLDLRAVAVGERGRMSVLNPVAPHLYHRLVVETPEGRRVERVRGEATYTHQLRAFRDWVRGGVPMVTDAAHGVANMAVIDAIYRAAGLPLRGA